MSRNIIETLLGGVVLVVAIAFLAYAYDKSNVGQGGERELIARFDRIDGLDVGGDVRISGIVVGSVVDQTLDAATYQAIVRFTVDPAIELPTDSSASIASSGLLGGKYLAVTAGAEEIMLENGEEITYTQSSVNFEDLIGKLIFSQGSESK